MEPKIIFQKIENGQRSIKKQRDAARSLLHKLTRKSLKHSQTGRPILDQSDDISISHKDDLVCIGIVPKPYRIGVDIEYINAAINMKLFLGPVVTKKELPFLKTFCKNKNLSLASGVAIFWSVKEAFFKCLDYDFKPGKVKISDIYKNNKARVVCSDEIRHLMEKRGLKLCFTRVAFDERYIYSQVLMEGRMP
jgi:phosphopantetheinyl transferase